jgi:hypothetical protein
MQRAATIGVAALALAGTVALAPSALAAPGQLVLVGCQRAADGPPLKSCTPLQGLAQTGALAFSADGRFAYASFPSGISVFDRNRRSGLLSFAQCLSATGGAPCTKIPGILGTAADIAVPFDGTSVYSAGGRRQTLIGFRRDRLDGRLTFSFCRYSSYGAQGDLPGCPVGGFEEARQVESSRDGRAVYLADQVCADNTGECFSGVHAYRRNPVTSALSLRDTSDPATAGSGPFALGRRGTLYEVDSEHGTISVFRRIHAAGLRRIQCLWPRTDPYGPHCATVPAMRRARAIALSPNGRSVITAIGLGTRAGGLVVFDRARDGKLRFRRCLAPVGIAARRGCGSLRTPRRLRLVEPEQLEFSRDGRSLYLVAGTDTARFLVRFKVNPRHGKLAFAQCFTAVRPRSERGGCNYVRRLRGMTEISLRGRFLYAITANRLRVPGPNTLVRFWAKRR